MQTFLLYIKERNTTVLPSYPNQTKIQQKQRENCRAIPLINIDTKILNKMPVALIEEHIQKIMDHSS